MRCATSSRTFRCIDPYVTADRDGYLIVIAASSTRPSPAAIQRNPAMSRQVFEFVRDLLLGTLPVSKNPDAKRNACSL